MNFRLRTKFSFLLMASFFFLFLFSIQVASAACGDTITDARDGKTYTTVLIGTQCWMKQNLNVGTKVTGATTQTNNGTIEKYCYSDSEANCTTDGGLYQWNEAMNYSSSCNGTGSSQPACEISVTGVCPTGWHIPSHYEWTALERAVCTTGSCATDFPYDESTTGWRGNAEGTKLKTSGTSGFEAILAGRVIGGSFALGTTNAYFWSSFQSGLNAWQRSLFTGNVTVHRGAESQTNGYSVRCILNLPLVAPSVVTDVVATVGNGQSSVSFAAPSSIGGSAILNYTVTSSPGSITSSSSTSPILVTGLTNGVTYTFTVTATNIAGTSTPSSPSNSVTPNILTGCDAAGGTISYSGNYTIHTFTSGGNFIPANSCSVDSLIVAGGGGGGARHGGGGGAGGLIYSTSTSLSAGTYAVVVGSGGSGATGGGFTGPSDSANDGQPSSVFGLTALGGGAGKGNTFGNSGGSGGGGGAVQVGGAGTAGQGNNGGTGVLSTYYLGAGGGGAGGVGGNPIYPNGGVGGVGLSNSISGSAVTYAAGGRGGVYETNTVGITAISSTGNGGGAAGGNTNPGGTGGSGIVIIKYLTMLPVTLPAITSSAATSISATVATLNGNITNTGGEDNTIRGFEYGLTAGYGTATSTTGSYGTGFYTTTLTGLTPNTTYHYRAYSTNSVGTSSSTDQSFLTISSIPTSVTATPNSSSQITVSWNANNNPGGTEYYVTNTTNSTNSGWITATTWSSTSLSPGTSYSYTVKSRNSANTETADTGAVSTTTFAILPTVTASAATRISASAATLNGNITNTGGENNTIRGFEYGLTTAYGTATSTTGTYSTGAYTTTLTGLSSETTYHYRAFSTNSAGTSSSTDQTFTTLDINSPVITILGDNPAFVNQNATYTDAGATSTDTVDGDLTSSIITTNNVNTAIVGNSSVVYTVADSSGNRATSTRVVTVLDITAPTLSTITTATTSSSATITWTTDELATSQVEYGPSDSYGSLTTTSNLSGTTTHSVLLPDLLACTNYHYRVISADLSDNTATSSDYAFSIAGCTAEASVTASSTEDVTTASGATVTTTGLTLDVPASYTATSSTVTFQAKILTGTEFFTAVSAPSSFSPVGDYIYNLQALINATTTLSTFSLPLTITISYNPATLGNISESSLVIYRYDAPTWTPLTSCSVNTTLHTVTCTTTNFSDFGLFGQVAVASGGTSGGTHFGCKDPKATNYEFFSSHRQSLCQYAIIPTTPPITIQISTSTPTTTKYLFTRNLKLYMTGADVKALQQYLNASGFLVSITGPGSKGAETTMFGGKTQAALIKYQKAKGITPAVGYFGPVTRGWVGR